MAKNYKTTLVVITQPLSLHYVFIFYIMKPHSFRIHVFRTTKLIHAASLTWLQILNLKFGALRHEKTRGLAFYTITRTSCLTGSLPRDQGATLISVSDLISGTLSYKRFIILKILGGRTPPPPAPRSLIAD